ncbi:hypothetical protein QCA50_010956 [Cerrena zonata]|uniref:Uncharacterized protein n=1 Tax=Cerrena zonata TaxID=2478898 RepID=A0AAW0G379_9APHY
MDISQLKEEEEESEDELLLKAEEPAPSKTKSSVKVKLAAEVKTSHPASSVMPWFSDDDVPVSHSGGEVLEPPLQPAPEQNNPAVPPHPALPLAPDIAPALPEPQDNRPLAQRRPQRSHIQSCPSGLPAAAAPHVASNSPLPSPGPAPHSPLLPASVKG